MGLSPGVWMALGPPVASAHPIYLFRQLETRIPFRGTVIIPITASSFLFFLQGNNSWLEMFELDILKMRPLSLWDPFSIELILGRATWQGKPVRTKHCPSFLPRAWLSAVPTSFQPCTLGGGDPAPWHCESESPVLIRLGKAVGSKIIC